MLSNNLFTMFLFWFWADINSTAWNATKKAVKTEKQVQKTEVQIQPSIASQKLTQSWVWDALLFSILWVSVIFAYFFRKIVA